MKDWNERGGSAFPTEGGADSGLFADAGMSMRDYFAAACPMSMAEAWAVWTNPDRNEFHMISQASERAPFLEWFAKLRFEYADAMLKECTE